MLGYLEKTLFWFETRRLCPNLVIKPTNTEKSFVENDWIGHTLAIGDEVRISITGSCPCCVMTTMAQGELPNDNSILRTAVEHSMLDLVNGLSSAIRHRFEAAPYQ